MKDGCSVVECKKRYTMSEFYKWAEYERIEPFGDYWLIQQTAVLCAAVVNAVGGKRVKPQDFLPETLKHNKGLSETDLLRLNRFCEGKPV